MSEKARKFRRAWILNPSHEMVYEEEIMKAYANQEVKKDRERIVKELEEYKSQNLWPEDAIFGKAIKIVNDE